DLTNAEPVLYSTQSLTPILQAAMYTYSISQGLFAGVSLEGTVIATRDEANAEYYGKPVAATDFLAGKVKAPAGAQKLPQVLAKYSAK
ncbi:MAG TPA: YSC84-related protein, partial [Candidatus Saccharimonadales bacterium]|nr:YSC84-related protein [Candidatus Saccharimonadales bacterium]